MTRLSREILIGAARQAVWALISDIGNVAVWNPNVESSECESGAVRVGTIRVCELKRSGRIEEQVSGWIEGEELWFAISRHGAVRSAEIGLVLRDATTPGADRRATTVEAVADYHLAIGPIGPVIDPLTAERLLTETLDETLAGLKSHLERPVTDGVTR